MKTIEFRTLLSMVAALVVAAWITSQQAQGAQQGQQYPKGERIVSNSQGWVYLVVPSPVGEQWLITYEPSLIESIKKRNAERVQRTIDQRAAEGWELVAVGAENFYFKRPR